MSVSQHPSRASGPDRRLTKRSATRRVGVRPLDDATTEIVRVIEFVWPAGRAIQPVLFVERKLLH